MKSWPIKASMTLMIVFSDPMLSLASTGGPLRLDQALVQVLERSPQLAAADYESRAAAARIKQAQLKTPFVINIDVENVAGSGFARNLNAAETTLSLVRVLELGNKPSLRGEVAQQTANLLGNSHDAQRLELLAEATRRFIYVVTDQERLNIAQTAVELSRRTEKIVKDRVEVGKSPLAELRLTGIEVARSELALEHAEHELHSSRINLTTMWGETQADFSTADADLFQMLAVAQFTQLSPLLERNPDLLRFATQQRLSEARVRLAQARRRTDVQISGGVRYLALTDNFAFVASARFPLGSKSRAEYNVKDEQLTSKRDPLIYEQRRLDIYALLHEIYQELSHAYTAVEILNTRIIPAAAEALKDYEKGYTAGRYSLLELNKAQQVMLNARLEVVLAAADYHQNQIEIERLTGAKMNTGNQP